MGRVHVSVQAILVWRGNIAGQSVLVRKRAFGEALLASRGHVELQRALEIQGKEHPPQLQARSPFNLGEITWLRSMEFRNVGLADSDAKQVVCVTESVPLQEVEDHENLTFQGLQCLICVALIH